MPPASLYHPMWFFLIALLVALIPIVPSFIHRKGMQKLQMNLLVLFLCAPCITALALIFASNNEMLISDFWRKLFLFKISPNYLMVILFLMPSVVLLATGISLFFGYSADQFSIAKQFTVAKGWPILGIAIPVFLAPLLEELGWRGYGVDSLRVHFNLFTTSLIFVLFWSAWHLPLFFTKGYYMNKLLDLGLIHVINYFASIVIAGFLINWVYYKTYRSIPACILFHSVLNLSMVMFKTKPFTKCIVTILSVLIVVFIIAFDMNFFFSNNLVE